MTQEKECSEHVPVFMSVQSILYTVRIIKWDYVKRVLIHPAVDLQPLSHQDGIYLTLPKACFKDVFPNSHTTLPYTIQYVWIISVFSKMSTWFTRSDKTKQKMVQSILSINYSNCQLYSGQFVTLNISYYIKMKKLFIKLVWSGSLSYSARLILHPVSEGPSLLSNLDSPFSSFPPSLSLQIDGFLNASVARHMKNTASKRPTKNKSNPKTLFSTCTS